MIFVKNHRKDLLIFLMLAIVVGWLQINLLEPHLYYGFTPDDWWPLAHFHFLAEASLLSKILSVWKLDGTYTTYQVLYISLLHHFFGFNFEYYQITNHILKMCSALFLYPLITIVFRNRLLAFITSVLYAMAYSPVGTLEIVAKGSDFISICFLSIFLLVYYYVIKNAGKDWKWYIFLSLMLVFTIFLSPIRMYPLLALILIIEAYLCITQRTKGLIIKSIKRILFLFVPYFFVLIFSPNSILKFVHINDLDVLRRISIGNWQLILHPLGSFGSLFLLNDYWKIFGTIQISTFTEYLSYLLITPLIIYLLITSFYLIILSIPGKRYLGFLLKVISLNVFFQIIIFFIFKHSEFLPANIKVSYDSAELYPVFFAVFILIISLISYGEWIRGKDKNNLILGLWLGPLFAVIFIILTWILSDYIVIFKGVHSYLNVPSIGSSLFIASTIVLLYQRIKRIKVLGKFLAPLVLLLLIPFFNINKNIIDYSFALSSYSMNANEQQNFRTRVWNVLGNYDNTQPALFYFGTLQDRPNGRFYEQTMLGRFGEWMFFQAQLPPDRCLIPVFLIDKIDILKNSIAIQNGEKGFYYKTFCEQPYFYKIKDFYAFELINKQPIDIKNKILLQLGITQY